MTAARWAEPPRGAVVVLDSAPIIYYLQDHPEFAARAALLVDGASAGNLTIAISTITLSEVIAGPLAAGNEILAAQYREVLCRSPNWQTVPVDEEVAVEAARIRARYRLRLPDAIQVATAIVSRAWALVTHDRDFARIKNIRVQGLK